MNWYWWTLIFLFACTLAPVILIWTIHKEGDRPYHALAVILMGICTILWLLGGGAYKALNLFENVDGRAIGDVVLASLTTPFAYFAIKIGIQQFWVVLGYFLIPVIIALIVFIRGGMLLYRGVLICMGLAYLLMWCVVALS